MADTEKQVKRNARARSGGKCSVCSVGVIKSNRNYAHIVADYYGGRFVEGNIEVTCESCNKSCGKCNLNTYKKLFNAAKQKLIRDRAKAKIVAAVSNVTIRNHIVEKVTLVIEHQDATIPANPSR